MKLTDLNPRWIGAGGTGITTLDGKPVPARHGIGMLFDCPCERCGNRAYVAFSNPLDGGPPVVNEGEAMWQRTGEDFETLTLSPSIHRVGGCGWHGYITAGNLIDA